MNKKILNLAIPNIISNLSIPLLSSVDTAVVGHLDKLSYLGAIAVGTMIFNFIYWGFGFLRMGTTGLTAQAVGKEDEQESINILGRATSFAIFSSLLLIIFQGYIVDLALGIITSTDEVELYAKEYFHIRIYAAPATLILYGFHGWFLGNQNAKYPLILSVAVNVLNIIFNLFFIYGMGMKSEGVALGTVVAQYLGLLLAIILYLRKYSNLTKLLVINSVFDFSSLKKFFSLNFDIFIRTLGLILVLSYFTVVSADFGEEILAANTILFQLWMILAYGVDGFAFAAESLVGKYYGASDKNNIIKVIKYSMFWGVGLGVLTSFIYYLFGEQILFIYTDKINIVNICLTYFIWIIIAPIINSFCFIWDGIFIGATASKAMRNTMIICVLLFFVTYYFSKDFLLNDGLWLSITIFMVLRAVTLTFAVKRNIFDRLKAV